MQRKRLNLTPLAAAVLLTAAGTASAVDFHGYFRSGIAWGNKDGGATCFSLPGVGGNGNGRLGNECGTYGEVQFDQNMFDGKDGVKFDYHIMFGYSANNNSDFENLADNTNAHIALRQNYGEMKNLPMLNGGSVWIGKRYYQRHDVHITDFFYWNDSGPGAGIENFGLGGDLKGSLAVLRENGFAFGSALGNATTKLDGRIAGIGLGPVGALEVGIQYNKADASPATVAANTNSKKNGTGLMLELSTPVLGGVNKLFLQKTTGSAGYGANLGSPNNFPGNQDGTTAILDSLQWQVSPDFSGQAVAQYYKFKNNYKWTAIAVRPVFHVSDYFKIQAELSHNRVKPDGLGSATLNKFTIAPTLVTGRGFWTRPELRMFYSYNKWNAQARDGVFGPGAGTVAGGTAGQFGNDTKGSIWGFQVESWW